MKPANFRHGIVSLQSSPIGNIADWEYFQIDFILLYSHFPYYYYYFFVCFFLFLGFRTGNLRADNLSELAHLTQRLWNVGHRAESVTQQPNEILKLTANKQHGQLLLRLPIFFVSFFVH